LSGNRRGGESYQAGGERSDDGKSIFHFPTTLEVLYMNDLRVNTNAGKTPSCFRQLAYGNLKNFYDALDDRSGGR
jgi:hypothetical protein